MENSAVVKAMLPTFCSCFLVVTVMAMAVCVAMAFVGADGLDDCPAEPMVPKYLMVAGILFIALAASAVAASVAFFACTRVVDSTIPLKWRDPCVAAPPIAFCSVASAFILVMAAWHIVGAVYVYSYATHRGENATTAAKADDTDDDNEIVVSDHHLTTLTEPNNERQEHDDDDADVQLGYCNASLLNFAVVVLTLGLVAAVAFPVGCYLRVKRVARQIAEDRERKRAQRQRSASDTGGMDNGGFSTIESESRRNSSSSTTTNSVTCNSVNGDATSHV